MQWKRICSALALGCALAGSAALADNPNDPAMRSKAARARDHAIIQRLNRAELARVRARDARWAREAAYRRSEHEQAMESYRQNMAAWRRAVAKCRAGDWRYCDR